MPTETASEPTHRAKGLAPETNRRNKSFLEAGLELMDEYVGPTPSNYDNRPGSSDVPAKAPKS